MKCPRCDADTVRVMTKSPVGDVWEVYVCDTCSYSWRSTEEIHVHDVFKLKPEDIPNFTANSAGSTFKEINGCLGLGQVLDWRGSSSPAFFI